ncbi:hypothetical protein CGH76_20915 [Vibrio parahaemolyticus]|uniref:hypothetical protein n=1 Tax=Vibrio parahaemolyticus TaxID=670 RepID=UPI0011206793|nr:hypothetical protein [Vibrio parahaemolyticus]TOM46656.1 hypothetical protein CGH76_20915 [Vibrio parahaemolyticus]
MNNSFVSAYYGHQSIYQSCSTNKKMRERATKVCHEIKSFIEKKAIEKGVKLEFIEFSKLKDFEKSGFEGLALQEVISIEGVVQKPKESGRIIHHRLLQSYEYGANYEEQPLRLEIVFNSDEKS